MGGDLSVKRKTTWKDFPKVCKRCQTERLGRLPEKYSVKLCEQGDCPSYAPWVVPEVKSETENTQKGTGMDK